MESNGGKCTELDINPEKWSKSSPLPKPEWMRPSLEAFQRAIKHQNEYNRDASLKELSAIDDNALRSWFVEHAQNIGKIRFTGLGSKSTPLSVRDLDPNKAIGKYEAVIFAVDSYKCVYCDWPVFPKVTFKALSQYLNSATFSFGRTNEDRPGIYLTFCATLDHLVPYARGGRTDETNLVTSCWPCNYGKAEYSLEEIGLTSISITWKITQDSLARLAKSDAWKESIPSLPEGTSPQNIYGPDGTLGFYSSMTWASPSEMRSDLMQNMGGGVPLKVIDSLVTHSRVLSRN